MDNIRNIALAGHGGRGKTTLAEAMLYIANASERLGRVGDGNTVMDYDPEEKRRLASISLAVAPLEWGGSKVNLLDSPGMFDFAGEVAQAVRASESVLIVEAAGDDYGVSTEKAFKAAAARDCAVFFAVTKCDMEHHDFFKSFSEIRARHETKACPVVVPVMDGDVVTGYADFLSGVAYKYEKGKPVEIPFPESDQIEELREVFKETVASADDDLMEKYFEGEDFTPEELTAGLTAGVAAGSIYPVYACSGQNTEGVDLLLRDLSALAPAPSNEGIEDSGVNAICFKTIADPFVGKMSFFKVVTGAVTAGEPAYNARTGESERMGKVIAVKGAKQEDVPAITAGDIGVITKLSSFKTGDTLSNAKNPQSLAGIAFPAACLSMAAKVRKKGEEEKVSSGMARLIEEDPSLRFENNRETHEQVISGLGDQHLDVVASKLKTKFGVEIDLAVPRVAYRETIRKKVEKQGKHKKQSGGSGQYGDVYIRFEPCEEDFIFDEEVVGGTVPKQYFPAVEKGLRECVAKGFLAGYPMVGLKAVLYFGSYHSVDSSEIAFKAAAHVCFRNTMPEAAPTILEPIGTLVAVIPTDNMGDIMGDITKRRGRVMGMGAAEEPQMQQIEAEVPLAEMGDFATALRSVTAGRGYFSVEFARYEDAPAMVQQKVIEEAAKRREAEEKE
ncbi:MAG: elongation factor G [Oscillospiraceae bacterium]|nr:elongation factor G [Oscillospiraceae bacterium]